jgi:hypothetical protein
MVLWDRAGFHAKQNRHPMAFIPFPPYCPELNPIEPLWDTVKRTIANQAWDRLEKIEEAMTTAFISFWEHPEKVHSLLGKHPVTQIVKAFLDSRDKSLIFK